MESLMPKRASGCHLSFMRFCDSRGAGCHLSLMRFCDSGGWAAGVEVGLGGREHPSKWSA